MVWAHLQRRGMSAVPGHSMKLDVHALARQFGAAPADVERHCGPMLQRMDLSYRPLAAHEREAMILEAIKAVDDGVLSVAGPERLGAWERGWGSNLAALIDAGLDVTALQPGYVKENQVMRLQGDFVRPAAQFERDYTAAFRAWILGQYLSEAKVVYEFGCGTAQHLAYLAVGHPGRRMVGLDWTQASLDIIGTLARHYGWPLEGRKFDFFSPDKSLSLEPGAGVFTFGALEQTGDRWGDFLEYLMVQRPSVCLHVEPLLELYDESLLLDYLATRYHRKRRYLNGFLTRLREFDAQGRIRIEKEHRHRFGTRFCETFSYVVWRPA
jgi:hypothetical protein